MTAISKITIDLGDNKKLELTPEQAKELKHVLDDIYHEPVVTAPQIYPWPVYTPWRYWGVYVTQGSNQNTQQWVPYDNAVVYSGLSSYTIALKQ